MGEMNKAKIMIVEDDKIISMEMRLRLKNMGYDVVAVVTNGMDAIQVATEKTPDVVIMDIKLEGYMDGIQAADRIHFLLDIPIVFLTAYTDDVTYQRAKETEPFGFIAKPFDEQVFKSSLDYALSGRAL
jgi:two-component system, response regulator PdtaR